MRRVRAHGGMAGGGLRPLGERPVGGPGSDHLAEAAVPHAACQLLHLRHLVGHTFLLIELLSQRLQLCEGQLQRQPVRMLLGGVLQHVLKDRGQPTSKLPVDFRRNRWGRSRFGNTMSRDV